AGEGRDSPGLLVHWLHVAVHHEPEDRPARRPRQLDLGDRAGVARSEPERAGGTQQPILLRGVSRLVARDGGESDRLRQQLGGARRRGLVVARVRSCCREEEQRDHARSVTSHPSTAAAPSSGNTTYTDLPACCAGPPTRVSRSRNAPTAIARTRAASASAESRRPAPSARRRASNQHARRTSANSAQSETVRVTPASDASPTRPVRARG